MESLEAALAEVSGYAVRALDETSVGRVLELYRGNPLYFAHLRERPTAELVRSDLAELPPGLDPARKRFLGFFAGDELCAVLDLLLGYPDDACAYIGLFMVAERLQGRGLGRHLVACVLRVLGDRGFSRARLGYVADNPQSAAFWRRCAFRPLGEPKDGGGVSLVECEREIAPAVRAGEGCKEEERCG